MAAPAILRPSPTAGFEHLVWRGGELASTSPGRSSGYPQFDAVLPGGGWSSDALTEILVADFGVGELGLLLPLLQKIPERKWVVCINPPALLYPPALKRAGVALERLLFVDPESPAHARWAARQAIESRSCSAVILWLANADTSALRRLQLSSEEHATPLFLVRPLSVASQPSPAVLRLSLTPRAGGIDIRILKRKGPQLAGPISLDLPWPVPKRPAPATGTASEPSNPAHGSIHALVRPLPLRAATPGLHARPT